MRVNLIEQLELEATYYGVAVQYVNYYAIETPLRITGEEKFDMKKSF